MNKPDAFNDYLVRLFPQESLKENHLKIAGNHVYNITFQVTNQCNLACSYCYQHNKNTKKMSFETAKKFIDIILAGDERSSKYINSYNSLGAIFEFIGGEPFLEIDLIDQITEYILTELIRLNHPWLHRTKFSISTNGILYFEPKVQEYINKYKNFLSLTITMDGHQALHDMCRKFPDGKPTYDIVHNAVEDWRKKITIDATKITISPENVDKVSEALLFLIQDEKYKLIYINCVYEEGWNNKNAFILYKELKKVIDFLLEHNLQDDVYVTILNDPCGGIINSADRDQTWCGGSGLMISVDPDGNIYPCLRYAPSSIGEELAKETVIGNVNQGFIINHQQEELLNQFKKVNRQTQLSYHERCKTCPISQGCGDCAAYSYEISKKIGYRTNFHCATHIVRTLLQNYFVNKSYLLTKAGTPMKNNVPKDWALEIIPLNEYLQIKQVEEEALYGTNV